MIFKWHSSLVVSVGFGFIAWLSLRPYVVWGSGKVYPAVLSVTCLFFFMHALRMKRSFSIDEITYGSLLIFCVFYFSISLMLYYGLNYKGLLVRLVPFVLLIYASDTEKVKGFLVFRWLFAASLIPGMVAWCVYVLNLPFDWLIIGRISDADVPNQLKVENGIYYYELYGSVILGYMLEGGSRVFRLQAMFDEPGVLGTFAALFLVADKMNLKRKINIILLLAGMMSMSLAFFGIIAIYSAFYFNKVVRYSILILLLAIALIFIIYSSEDLLSYVQRVVISRVEWSEGGFKGDNREMPMLLSLYNLWQNSGITDLLFGLSEAIYGYTGSSWKIILIKNGIVGFVLILLVLLMGWVMSRFKYDGFVLLMVFVASIYQRPNVLNLPYFLLFLGGLAYLSSEKVGLATLYAHKPKKIS